jgi:hypothetical protein
MSALIDDLQEKNMVPRHIEWVALFIKLAYISG